MDVEFGVILQCKKLTPSFKEIKKIALEADELGFHSIWISDHLMHPAQVEDKPMYFCHEAWTTMSALGALTQNIRLGFNVLIPYFRHPSVIAKMATTLDILTNGRLILCLGAGWFEREFEAYGVPWIEDHDERIEGEREAALLIKMLWTQPVANFSGKYFQIKNAVMEPKPIQKPHPPIWFGGKSPKTMEVVSKLAEGWLLLGVEPEKIKDKIETMQQMLGNRNLDYAIALEKVSTDHPTKCIHIIQKYINSGANLLNFPFYDVESLRIFAKDVIPTFK